MTLHYLGDKSIIIEVLKKKIKISFQTIFTYTENVNRI